MSSNRKRNAPDEEESRSIRPRGEIEQDVVMAHAPAKPMSEAELAHWNSMFFELLVRAGWLTA